MQTLGDIAHELEQLRRLLLRLPPKVHPTGLAYPFEGYLADEEYVELTGSIQGAVNHTLEVAFGSRANIDNSPLEFESHGPDLVALMSFLLDLLSEIPVPGANLPFPPDRADNAPSKSGREKQPLVAEAFTF